MSTIIAYAINRIQTRQTLTDEQRKEKHVRGEVSSTPAKSVFETDAKTFGDLKKIGAVRKATDAEIAVFRAKQDVDNGFVDEAPAASRPAPEPGSKGDAVESMKAAGDPAPKTPKAAKSKDDGKGKSKTEAEDDEI